MLTPRAGRSGTTLRAEFTDASPLVEGMSVRVSGAVAGSVREIELTDRGTVLVEMNLHDGLPEPRADASASIRQQDLLGDSYLSLSLGDSRQPLRGPIRRDRAITSPRFDEFFDIFSEPARDGFQALTAELALALDRRGADLNEAILRLRPGFEAADELLAELSGQNQALRAALTNSRAITAQVAPRTRQLERAIGQLATILAAVAGHADGLDAGLARLPATLRAATGTVRSLGRFAVGVRPLARTLRDGAPAFERSVALLADWAPAAGDAVRAAAPVLEQTGRALRDARPGLRAVRGKDLNVLLGPATQLSTLLAPIFGDVTAGLFGSAEGGGFGGIGVPGNDPTDPTTDPARGYVNGSLMLSCEVFGEPIAPGCLNRIFSPPSQPRQTPRERRPARKPETAPARKPAGESPPQPAATPAPSPGPLQQLTKPLQDLSDQLGLPPVLKDVPKDLDSILDYLLAP